MKLFISMMIWKNVSEKSNKIEGEPLCLKTRNNPEK